MQTPIPVDSGSRPMNPSPASYQTTRAERLSYGGFFLGQNIIYTIQFQFLVYFYTESVGLTLASTTLLLLIARVYDALIDPIMGAIVDKSRFKSGQYLPWLRAATYLIPLALLAVFVRIDGGGSANLLYAYVSYLIWGMVYTTSDSPLFSLSTAMTSNLYERDKLIAYGRLAAALAAISSAAFMSIKAGLGWTGAAGVYCLIAFLVMLPLQFTAKERVRYRRSERITFAQIAKFLFKNKYLLIYYAGYMAIGATNTLQTVVVYFANANLGDEGLVTIILGTTILPIVVIAPLLPRLIRKFGKKRLTVYGSVAAVALSIVQYYVGYDDFAVFLAFSAVRVLFMQIPMLIYGMFTADCIEYGAYRNGERTPGIAFSVQTLITKLSGALSSSLSLMLLGYFGYVEQAAQQTARTLDGIWFILTIVPAVGYAVMIAAMAFYKLDEKTVARMIEHNLQR